MTPNRRTKRTRPNDRTQRAAHKLADIGVLVTEAVEHIYDELHSLGIPSSSGKELKQVGGYSDPVSHDAVRSGELKEQRENLRDLITSTCDKVDAIEAFALYILGRPRPNAEGIPLCADKQVGREGAIEWGDPTCTELGVQGGLCYACYQRERRWRMATGRADRAEPAA